MEVFDHLTGAVLGLIILVIIISVLLIIKIYNRLTLRMCDSDQDMTGKTVLITGGTAGIGKTTAEGLARRNARVILACRNVEKGQRVAEEIKSSIGNHNVLVKHLDLSSFKSVRKCAKEILQSEERLDILINNAGSYSVNKRTTEDGCETIMQTNHLGHFLLTLLLYGLLKKSAPSRIINVSSLGYLLGKIDLSDMEGKNCRNEFELYTRSKLANILFTTELASRLSNSGVTVNALHPGLVKTTMFHSANLVSRLIWRIVLCLAGMSEEEGAQTSIYLAVHPEVEKITGRYFSNCKEEKLKERLVDPKLAKELFEVSLQIVGFTDQMKF